eukprot:840946-Amphidinium_carterae.1
MGRCFRCGSPHHGLAACSKPTRPTNPGPEASAADSTPNNGKPNQKGKAKGKGIGKGKKGKGKGKGKPKPASPDVAEEETWEEGGEDWCDDGGEEWQGKSNQRQLMQRLRKMCSVLRLIWTLETTGNFMVLGFIGLGFGKLSAFIPTGEVNTEMIDQNTGEKYASRETKYRPGQRADRLGFQWTGVTKFRVMVALNGWKCARKHGGPIPVSISSRE